LGILADEYSDVIYLTAEDPRNESVKDINSEIKSYIERPCYEIEDRKEAIITALNNASSGETVVVYGKGTEDSQAIGGNIVPYESDTGIVEEWMKENV
ncbi:MAG: glutamate ligase domain-containing protein, partial [Coprococcus sp.]